jgi:hypothetical protein
MKKRPEDFLRPPDRKSFDVSTSAYLELPEPLDELPPAEPLGLGVLLGDELPEDEPPAAPPDELLPLDGELVEPELPDGLVAELLPDDGGELFVAVEPLLGGLLEPLLFEPELSQATSEAADRKAAAISHLFSIKSSPYGFTCSGFRSHMLESVTVPPITERSGQKFRARFSSHRHLARANARVSPH